MIKQKIGNVFKWIGFTISMIFGLAGIIIAVVFSIKYNKQRQELIDGEEEEIKKRRLLIEELNKKVFDYRKKVDKLKTKHDKNKESMNDLIK